MAPSRIVTLAREIEANTTKLDDYLATNSLAPPSFEEDVPLMYQLPPVDELWWLNEGPLMTIVAKVYNSTSVGLHTILKYDLHNLVPLETGTTFQDLADKIHVPVKKLTRLLRHGMTDHFFREPQPGYIKHTVATKALVQIPMLDTWARMSLYEMVPAKMHIVDAVAKWLESEEPHHGGYSIANDTTKTTFEFWEDQPERMNRFKTAMSFIQSVPGFGSSYVAKWFDWQSLGKGKIVDVGGSHGLMSIGLARAVPDLHFIVQDLPSVISDAETKAPPELADRVTFMAHDFFTEQPIKGADVYYLRWILHDWSDKDCIKILKSLIPALKPGARIMLSEACLEPPCTLSFRDEKRDREADIMMMAMNNSQERDHEDWEGLFRATDPGLKLEEVRMVEGAKLDLLIVKWDGIV